MTARAARQGGCSEPAEISLLLTDDQSMQELNRQYRGLNQPTDVLSFALEESDPTPRMPDAPRVLGDVVVSVDTVARQALENDVDADSELAWAICHGVLHLLGFDHQTPADLERMREMEQSVLSQMGRSRPS